MALVQAIARGKCVGMLQAEQPCLEDFNPAFARLFGIKSCARDGKALQRPPAAAFGPFVSAALRCSQSRAPARLQLSLDAAEGPTECDFLLTAIEGYGGKVERIAGQGRIQRSARATHCDHDGQLDCIARTTRDVLYVFDHAMKPNLFLNERVHDVLGYGADEIRQMTLETLKAQIHPDDLLHVVTHYRKLAGLASGTVISIEYRMRHADGHYVFLTSRDTVLKSDNDVRATKIIGCATDVS